MKGENEGFLHLETEASQKEMRCKFLVMALLIGAAGSSEAVATGPAALTRQCRAVGAGAQPEELAAAMNMRQNRVSPAMEPSTGDVPRFSRRRGRSWPGGGGPLPPIGVLAAMEVWPVGGLAQLVLAHGP